MGGLFVPTSPAIFDLLSTTTLKVWYYFTSISEIRKLRLEDMTLAPANVGFELRFVWP